MRTVTSSILFNCLSPAPNFEQWLSLLQGGYPTVVTVDKTGQIYLAGQSWNGLPVTSNAFARLTRKASNFSRDSLM